MRTFWFLHAWSTLNDSEALKDDIDVDCRPRLLVSPTWLPRSYPLDH
jgi:hypothetical protein